MRDLRMNIVFFLFYTHTHNNKIDGDIFYIHVMRRYM